MTDSAVIAEFTRQHEAVPPVRDRLVTTTFLVAMLHAIVILGVTFGNPLHHPASDVASLEVLLVQDPVAEERDNPDAAYLAQATRHGRGNVPDGESTQRPRPVQAPQTAEGNADEDAPPAAPGHGGAGDQDLVASRAAGTDRRWFATQPGGAARGAPMVLVPAPQPDAGSDESDQLRLRGQASRELVVTADTRASGVAVYLAAWRQRIEHLGTLNYPMDVARARRMTGNPVLEVQIRANGTLGEAYVQRSSGYAELDEAALGILKLAAPFAPFPRALAAQHDALRLRYEWQFLDGRLTESSVSLPGEAR